MIYLKKQAEFMLSAHWEFPRSEDKTPPGDSFCPPDAGLQAPVISLLFQYISHTERFINEKTVLEITFRGKGKHKECPCCSRKTKKQHDQYLYIQKDIRHCQLQL
jgi:hypothetical protein